MAAALTPVPGRADIRCGEKNGSGEPPFGMVGIYIAAHHYRTAWPQRKGTMKPPLAVSPGNAIWQRMILRRMGNHCE
ncbi:Uncharacterised protein [Mycobacteroides abscessus subsp. abscessus]|nr:Uncharacterised protein [Mycobacteroides abscessus subsp. abscessus]